ncbi:hypothetical protein EST38_g5084 [Candolleomyces aberdarensis]|uniref:Uncharacterized protein n=1 Tax=Candolleomyces aberdarensis TaxID=2316362 RepID=A0A4Q2DPK4_9AGAR|nr:hypothetical protein EST38_g5084 [Candolleomyces aberdarensis]
MGPSSLALVPAPPEASIIGSGILFCRFSLFPFIDIAIPLISLSTYSIYVHIDAPLNLFYPPSYNPSYKNLELSEAGCRSIVYGKREQQYYNDRDVFVVKLSYCLPNRHSHSHRTYHDYDGVSGPLDYFRFVSTDNHPQHLLVLTTNYHPVHILSVDVDYFGRIH